VLAAAQDADPASRGWAMFYASRLAGQRGGAEKASALLQDSLRLFRQGADMPGEIFALSHLGMATARRGKTSAGLDLGVQSVERARALGDPWYLAMALNNYGCIRVMSGNVDDGTGELLAESLRLRRNLEEKRGVGFTLSSIAELQLLRGDLDAAAATVEEMLILSTALTHAELTCITFNLHGFLHLARGNPALAEERFRESLQRSYPVGFQLLIAEALLGLAEVAALQEDFTRALRFAVVANQALIAEEQQLTSSYQAAIRRIERHLEQALDPAAQQTIRAAAGTATLDQVLAEAAAGTQD
jgi:tetratricopeptide (TPR) repeat protein